MFSKLMGMGGASKFFCYKRGEGGLEKMRK